jgi:hypothetical protein
MLSGLASLVAVATAMGNSAIPPSAAGAQSIGVVVT